MRMRDETLMTEAMEVGLAKVDVMRPSNLVALVNGFSAMGLSDSFLSRLSSAALVPKLDLVLANVYKRAFTLPSVINHLSDEALLYIFDRLRYTKDVFDSQWTVKALMCGVGVRVLRPSVWDDIPPDSRRVLVDMSMGRTGRSLSDESIFGARQHYLNFGFSEWTVSGGFNGIENEVTTPSAQQWDVSDILANQLQIPHEHLTAIGPFKVDIQEKDERCLWFIDDHERFYDGTQQYLETVKVEHKILTLMGFDIRRITHDEWDALETDAEREQFVKSIAESEPMTEVLNDLTPPLTPQRVNQLRAENHNRRLARLSEQVKEQEASRVKLTFEAKGKGTGGWGGVQSTEGERKSGNGDR
eukprot:GHVN01105186.1.p1 GENE.GHVN01105186.1~~GHVN01105186.1.p1  ORF type:complete len:358 (-),score=67.72 GHVN01105186.1:207-1280(-)